VLVFCAIIAFEVCFLDFALGMMIDCHAFVVNTIFPFVRGLDEGL
jgi:hypothetical protein